MSHVKRGDMVIVTKGKEKGKRGKILRFVGERVVIEKVNMVKRHSKPTQQNPQGGIIEIEAPIAVSNVLLFNESLGKGVRTRMEVKDGKKVRVCVKSGNEFPNPTM